MVDFNEAPTPVEISVQISETTCYDIMIPRIIDVKTYPEIMLRLKAIHRMIPKNKIDDGNPQANVLLKLGLEETEDLIDNYAKLTPEGFSDYIKEKYELEDIPRPKVVSLIGRARKRMYKMRDKFK